MLPAENPSFLHIAIVDDQEADRRKLANAVNDFFSRTGNVSCEIMSYESAGEMLEAFSPGRFALAFLDIQMDGMNGIDLAASLRAEDTKLLIVFLTSSREYAFDAFPVHPFDYLTKPFTQDTLDYLLREVLRVFDTPDARIEVRTGSGTLSVPLNSIRAAASHGHAVELRLTDGQTLTCLHTFRELSETLLRDARFLQCNRGILINMDHVASLSDNNFLMTDGTVYPLRVKGRRTLVSQFSQYMISKMEGSARNSFSHASYEKREEAT